MASVELHPGDCLSILPTLARGSVDLVLTDPPYGHNNNDGGDLIRRREAALGGGQPGEARPSPTMEQRPTMSLGQCCPSLCAY